MSFVGGVTWVDPCLLADAPTSEPAPTPSLAAEPPKKLVNIPKIRIRIGPRPVASVGGAPTPAAPAPSILNSNTNNDDRSSNSKNNSSNNNNNNNEGDAREEKATGAWTPAEASCL